MIYRYYVPVTLSFFIFIYLIPFAFLKERNNNMEALVYSDSFLSTGAPTDGRRLHTPLSIT